jgi:uncharacterized protein (DUF1800 family)
MPRKSFKPNVNLSPGGQARVAFMRFGLGPKPGVAQRLAADGAAFQACLNEISNPAALLIPDAEVKTYSTDKKADVALDYASCCRFGAVPMFFATTGFLPQPTQIYEAEAAARYAKSLEPDIGFAERLVHFWSNHFSVYRSKANLVMTTVGHMERAVIRAGALGKFSDLLKSVCTHPAMVCYLENQVSIGPKSAYSLKNPKKNCSYNENLAREILELHTLGIDAGYTQADVTSFAKILTGWTVYPANHAQAGQFYFEPTYHEPGPQTVLGVTYSQTGMDQGIAVLDALARHPATAQHIAYKLVRHFVSDEPQPELVAYLARLFRLTGGNLQVMAKALICLPQFWNEPMVRLIQPLPWQMSILRGMGVSKEAILMRENSNGILSYTKEMGLHWILVFLGQSNWGSLTPDGFSDENYFWMNANSVRIRKDVAAAVANHGLVNGKAARPPTAIAADLLSGFLSDATASTLADMEKKKAADKHLLVMLFVSPEYILR